jgi:hypothetical protein
MNQDVFEKYYTSRFDLTLIVNYETNFNDDPKTRRSHILILVRDHSKYSKLHNLTSIVEVLNIPNDTLNEHELYIKNRLVELFAEKATSKITIIQNSYITQETSLSDTKMYLSIILNEVIKKTVYSAGLYLEDTATRKPIQSYISGMHELDLLVKSIVLDNLDGNEVSIDDILLKNIESRNDIYTFNMYNINDYIDAIRKYKTGLIAESDKKLAKFLHNFWIKIESNDILKRLKSTEFPKEFIESNESALDDYRKLIRQESEYNELFWKVKLSDDMFKHIGIYFNSFILENKENKRDRTIDIYSVFKYFKLDNNVSFSRYSYGNQVAQKMVKIYEDFYSIENIKYLEKWGSNNSYRDTPSNCVQWKGFYNYTDTDGSKSLLDYELILFNDCTYQIRLYHQKINLSNIEDFFEFIKDTILSKIKTILYGIGITLELKKLELGKNIHFTYSKLEINIVLNKELEVGKLQSVLNKSSFIFDKASDIMSNEFVNLEFKKVNNYTRADQIFKYINYYVIQNRITEVNELGPVIKQVMAKYNKNVLESTELVQGWIRRFIDVDNQQNRKIQISKNIGLDVVGKQLSNSMCNFYMSNVIGLEDIYTFYYYLIVLLNWSQNVDNNKIYIELVGRKTDEKLIAKVQNKKDIEDEVDLIGDLDDLVFEDAGEDAYIFNEKDDIEDTMSVHSELEEAAGLEDTELPTEEDVFDELKPIVNGTSYYIKRLQMMDKEIYDYKVDDRYKPYSKKAMPNDSRQPIILSSRQIKKIREKYGDDTNVYGGIRPDIEVYSKDYKQSSYQIKYRNLHYICPKVWCMLDQLPYYMDSLKEKTSSGLVDAKVAYNEKGEYLVNPKRVVCPDCGNGIWNNDTKEGTLLIAQDNLKRQPYPGFFSGDGHPKGNCMVSCFKRPNQKLDECMGEQKVVKKEKKISNEKYILKGDKYGKCSYGRFCVLPNKIHEWMNRDFGNFKNERTIGDEYIGYLRKGVLNDDQYYYHSFEKTIQYLLGDTIFEKTSVQFREYLIDKLKSIPNIDKIFRKCRKGSLYLYFDSNIENFYKYITETISLQPKFILPVLSYPTIIADNGMNFYVIREENNKIYLDCEYFDYTYNEDRINADNMLIYSYSVGETYKKVYYEPIIRVQQKSKVIQITRSLLGISKHSILEDMFKYVKKECSEKEDPLITRVKGLKITDDEYFLPKTPTMQIIHNILQSSEFQIMFQYVNPYNQTEGIFVKCLQDNNKYYLPIKPVEILDDIRIIKSKELLKLNTFENTRKFLESITTSTNIAYSPYFYTLNSDKSLITGIFSISGEWIPTLYIEKRDDLVTGLKSWNIAKDIWIQKPVLDDDRTVNKTSRDTKRLNYEKLRFELSKLINSSDVYKQTVLDKMRDYKSYKDISDKNKVRSELINSISGFLRLHLVNPGIIGDWNIKDVFNYCNSNENLERCNNGSMCRWNGENNTCKMIVNPEWYWKFISRIVDEILVNVNKRKEVIDEYRKELEIPQNESIFYSKDELDTYLEKYDFTMENKKYIQRPLEHFDYTNPKHPIGDETLETSELYTITKYIKHLFDSQTSGRVALKDLLGVFASRDTSPNYFFDSIDEIIKVINPGRKLYVSSRNTLAQQIRKYPEGEMLLDRYKTLSENEGGQIYRKFVPMRTIEALADYVKENSWGNVIDLELLASAYIKYKIRFIILNDVGHMDKKNLFTHLPDGLNGLTETTLDSVNYIIFVNHNNRFNMLFRKDTKTPIFNAGELPFIYLWFEKQRLFEENI